MCQEKRENPKMRVKLSCGMTVFLPCRGRGKRRVVLEDRAEAACRVGL